MYAHRESGYNDGPLVGRESTATTQTLSFGVLASRTPTRKQPQHSPPREPRIDYPSAFCPPAEASGKTKIKLTSKSKQNIADARDARSRLLLSASWPRFERGAWVATSAANLRAVQWHMNSVVSSIVCDVSTKSPSQ